MDEVILVYATVWSIITWKVLEKFWGFFLSIVAHLVLKASQSFLQGEGWMLLAKFMSTKKTVQFWWHLLTIWTVTKIPLSDLCRCTVMLWNYLVTIPIIVGKRHWTGIKMMEEWLNFVVVLSSLSQIQNIVSGAARESAWLS